MPLTDAALDLFGLCLALAPAALPDLIWWQWSFAPAIVLPLGLMLVLHFGGLRRLAAEAEDEPRKANLAFLAGWTLLVLALVSPMCRLAATLTSAHMAQVTILAVVAPLLLALGRGWETIGTGMQTGDPPEWDERKQPAGTRLPLIPVAILYGVTLWALHAPPVYAAVLSDATIHIVGVFSLVGVSLAFWTSVLDAGRFAPGRAAAVLLATMAHAGLLGAILIFAGTMLYPLQAAGAPIWGMEPLADQRLAGVILWVVGCGLFFAAGLRLAWKPILRSDAETRAER